MSTSLSDIRSGATPTTSLADIRGGPRKPPESVSLEQIRQATADGPQHLPAAEAAGGEARGDFNLGVERGISQTKGLGAQFTKAIGGATGLESLVEFSDEAIAQSFAEVAANPAKFTSLEEIGSVGDAIDFVQQTFGEQFFNLAIAATGGGVGAGLGRYVAKRGLAGEAARAAAKKGMLRGAEAGTFASFLPINTGEILQEAYDQGFEPELGPNLALGAASTILEVAGFELIGRAIFRDFKPDQVSATLQNILKRIGHTSLAGVAVEGGTEAVQEAMVIASRKLNDPNFSITEALQESENLKRIGFAGVSGAIVGGGLGGGGAVISNTAMATRANLQAARVRDRVDAARLALTELVAGAETVTPEGDGRPPEVQGLFDVEQARKKTAATVQELRTMVGTALAAVKEKLSPTDQRAAQAAAESRSETIVQDLAHELETLDMAGEELERSSGRIGRAIQELRRGLAGVASIAEKTAKESEATKKMVERINQLLEEAKSLSTRERLAKVEEMLELAQEGIRKGLIDPNSVARGRLRVLVNRIDQYARAGIRDRRKAIDKYRNALKVFDTQVQNLKRKLPQGLSQEEATVEATPTEAQSTTTPVKRILSSIQDVVQGTEKAAIAAGYTLSTLPQAVKTAAGRAGVIPRQEQGRVVFTKPEDKNIDVDAESFSTSVDEIAPEDAATVAAVKEGGERRVEVIDKRDPVSAREAVQRAEQIAGETGNVEIGSLDQEVAESVRELVDETQQQGVDNDYLLEVATSVEEQAYDIFVRAANGKLVAATVDEKGNVTREDGKPHKPIRTHGEAVRVRNLKSSRTKFASAKVDILELGGEFVIGEVQPSQREAAEASQVRKVVDRGNRAAANGKENKFIIPAKTKDGKKVWLHLGEITTLGFVRNRGATTTFDKLTNAHRNFVEGLTTLITEYGFQIDFDPKRHANKVIYGRVTYQKSAYIKNRMNKLRGAFERHGEAAAEAGVLQLFEDGELSWNEVADWLLDEAQAGSLDTEDIGTVLFGQGAADPSLMDALKQEQVEKFDPEEESGLFPEETAPEDFFAEDPTVRTFAPGLKVGEQVSNMLTDAKGKTWAIAEKAVRWTLKTFNIKENVILYDEASAEGLMAAIRSGAFKVDGNVQATMVSHIREKISGEVAGNIRANLTEEGAPILIFVSQTVPGVANNVRMKNRGAKLMHELGHLIQYTHLDRLAPKTRKKILDSLALGPDWLASETEAFANYMARALAKEGIVIKDEEFLVETYEKDEKGVKRKRFKSKTREDIDVRRFFIELRRDLWKFYQGIKDAFKYAEPFEDFVAALMSHSRAQQVAALKTSNRAKLKTDFARTVFDELQAVDAGPYIVMADVRARAVQQGYRQELVDSRDRLKAQVERATDENDQRRISTQIEEINWEIEGIDNGVLPLPAVADMATAQQTAQRAESSIFKNYKEDFDDFVRRLKDNPLDAVKSLVYTTDAEIRSMGLEWLANEFHLRPGISGDPLTVFREIQQQAAPFYKKLSALLNDIPVDGRQALMEALMKVDANGKHIPSTDPNVRRIRRHLNEMYTWYTVEMGIPLREKRDYYPLMLDGLKIENDREGFVDILMQHGLSRRKAETFRQKVVVDSDGGLNNSFNRAQNVTAEFYAPSFASTRARADSTDSAWTPALRNALVEAGFYQDDLATTLVAYTEMAVRRAVWQKRFGETDFSDARKTLYRNAGVEDRMHSPTAKLDLKLAQAHNRGQINDHQYSRLRRDLLPAYAGQLGLRTNYHIRRLSAWAVIYQNLRLLGFAVLSSVVDVGTLIARTDLSDIDIHGQTFRQFVNKQDRQAAMEMLEDIGAMRQGLTEHILNDQALNTFMTGRAKRINDLFFRYNGMEGWTNLMRALALNSGRQFLIRHAAKAREGNTKSLRYLAELGVTHAEVAAWDGHSTDSATINAALNQFIDQSMIRPDPSIRPTWMSDPSYGVFAHLKGFMYGFHETFLRRAWNEATLHQNLLPFFMLGMMALPFAAIGYELRKKITGSQSNLSGGAYLQEVVERSGALGAFQFIADMEQSHDFGKPYGLGIAGPTVEQLYNFWTQDMSSFVPRSIPIVAQFPQAREWMRDELL